MTQWEIKELYEKNKNYCIGFLVVVFIILAGIWLVRDSHRNDTEYHHTDNTVEQLEKRIQSVESRLGAMQDRIEQTQKTVESVGRRISTSTGLAVEINEGTGRAEERLNSAIQRSGRIENIIADIERSNR